MRILPSLSVIVSDSTFAVIGSVAVQIVAMITSIPTSIERKRDRTRSEMTLPGFK